LSNLRELILKEFTSVILFPKNTCPIPYLYGKMLRSFIPKSLWYKTRRDGYYEKMHFAAVFGTYDGVFVASDFYGNCIG